MNATKHVLPVNVIKKVVAGLFLLGFVWIAWLLLFESGDQKPAQSDRLRTVSSSDEGNPISEQLDSKNGLTLEALTLHGIVEPNEKKQMIEDMRQIEKTEEFLARTEDEVNYDHLSQDQINQENQVNNMGEPGSDLFQEKEPE